MIEEEAILSWITSKQQYLDDVVCRLLFTEVTSQTCPYVQRKHSYVLGDDNIRAVIDMRDCGSHGKSALLDPIIKYDDILLDQSDVAGEDIYTYNEQGILEQFEQDKEL